jgi:nicotinate-nucleotide pyrophosphorylase (carboxylating)
MELNAQELKNARRLIKAAFQEDGVSKDITSRLFVPRHLKARAVIQAKEKGMLSGGEVAKQVFKMLDKKLKVQLKKSDGSKVKKNDIVLSISGPLRSILSAERTALNFLGHLSGIATLTQEFVRQAKTRKIKIMDTRKTTPAFRLLEKYAVRCGGGHNHRLSLEGTVFIKDNHWQYQDPKSWNKALQDLKRIKKELVVEVENDNQLKRAWKLKPDVILFDNLHPSIVKRLVRRIKRTKVVPKPQVEASGGIHLDNIRSFARSGADRISIGALTHSATNLDYSLTVL